MSMDLYVWKAPLVSSEDEAIQLLEREDEAFEPSEDVARFYDELLAKYPALESFDEEELDSAPTYWSVTPERSDRLIGMNLAWSVPDDALDDIVALARKYELVLFDPQGPASTPPRPWTSSRFVAIHSSCVRRSSVCSSVRLSSSGGGFFRSRWSTG